MNYFKKIFNKLIKNKIYNMIEEISTDFFISFFTGIASSILTSYIVKDNPNISPFTIGTVIAIPIAITVLLIRRYFLPKK